jgi:hypothetical protein
MYPKFDTFFKFYIIENITVDAAACDQRNITARRMPVVDPYYMRKILIEKAIIRRFINRLQTNISAQLTFFGVDCSVPLPAGIASGYPGKNCGGCSGKKSQRNPDSSYPIVQVAMLLAGIGCAGAGFWQMSSPRRNQFGPLGVIALLLTAWCLLVVGGIWLGLSLDPFVEPPDAPGISHHFGISV